MNERLESPRPAHGRNPFSTRRVRPGATPYLFRSGDSTEALVERLRTSGWWGEIVGPHGSGKSTLLATLVPPLQEAGRQLIHFELHDGQRRLPIDLRRRDGLDDRSVIVIDGYEQLARLVRFGIRRLCRRVGCGLIVTAHRPVGLPALYRTHIDLQTACRVVDVLKGDDNRDMLTDADVRRALENDGGDMREILFDLYDVFEKRSRGT